MSDIMIMATSFGVGLALGAVFYGGLYWTVQKGLASNYAPLWFVGSFWLRLSIAVGGFYLVAQGDWRQVLVCLTGFLIARIAVSLLTKDPLHVI